MGDQLLLTEYTGGNHGKLTANEGKEPLKYYRALGGIRKNLMSHNQNPSTSLPSPPPPPLLPIMMINNDLFLLSFKSKEFLLRTTNARKYKGLN